MSPAVAHIAWIVGPVAVADVHTPIGVLAQRTDVAWIILERPLPGRPAPLRYAFRPDELRDKLDQGTDPQTPALQALGLHEWGESPEVDPGATTAAPPEPNARHVASSRRVVARGAGGGWQVGEVQMPRMANGGTRRSAPPPREVISDISDILGDTRGGETVAAEPPGAPPEPPRFDALLSAEAPSEVRVGETAVIDVRLERAGEATPLAHVLHASLAPAEKITVILGVERGLAVVGSRREEVNPPGAGAPVRLMFEVKGVTPGPVSITVMFRQRGSTLGAIEFKTEVVPATAAAQPTTMRGETTAAPRDPADDEVLEFIVTEEQVGTSIRYHYYVSSGPLGLHFQEYRSQPLLPPPAGGSAALAWVQAMHDKIVKRTLLGRNDLTLLALDLKALGAELCRQLLSPELVRLLWDHRQQLRIVQVTSFEPYIPWELLRLEHPDTQEIDDRFLAEYGLVRTRSGAKPPATLASGVWRYVFGAYPSASLPKVDAEADYLTRQLAQRGVTPQPIPAEPVAFLAALAQPDFDVLHVSCHGETSMDKMDASVLILGDRRTPQGVERVTVSATTVQATARLKARHPLVFLNACKTGQPSPSLTDWGGWSAVFFKAGAGAFVGTSWSVYDKPAAKFAEAFYDAFRAGRTLTEAAVAARAAAKASGDASWLAYVVYGHPLAKAS